jgi:hypothetical protein
VIAHPYADRFPMLSGEELERLAADISENGLNNPIVLDGEGRILDGRNRWAACEMAGVTPETVVFDGDDVAAFVLSQNVARRHMSTGAQAMATALVLVDSGRRENGRWKRGSVPTDNRGTSVSDKWEQSMRYAGVILDHVPDLAADVVTGALSIDAAYREAERRRDAGRAALGEQARIDAEEADARKHLEQVAPEYLTRFDNARTAFAAWESDNREAAAKARQEKAQKEAAENQRRADLTHTFTAIAHGLQSVGSYGHAPIEEVMAEFEPYLLHPVQLIRFFDEDNIASGITFLTALLKWKKAQNG